MATEKSVGVGAVEVIACGRYALFATLSVLNLASADTLRIGAVAAASTLDVARALRATNETLTLTAGIATTTNVLPLSRERRFSLFRNH